MQVDVSVVMPLYNAKDYIKLTVDSILSQTLKNIEIVIVDDCSTDGSLDFCRELYGQDERVRIFQQPRNMGPGAARNTGIRSAAGKYISLVDSDDELLPDTLANLFEAAEKYNADIVHNTQFIYPIPDDDNNIPLQLFDSADLLPMGVETQFFSEVTPLNDDLSVRLQQWLEHKITWSVCNKMFRREFLVNNGIFFSDMKLAEDMVFCFECLFKSKNYVIVPGGGYVYRILSTSLSRGKKTPAHILKALKSQMGAVSNMRRILSGIPFFVDNPDKAVIALERVLDDIERGYIRPAFQDLGADALRSDDTLHAFMQEEFGEKAPYVEFLFYELHKKYEPVVDYFEMLRDMETWKALARRMREEKEKA